MKLRNKRTGEIVEPFGITCVNGRTFVQFDDEKGTFKFEAHSLAELNEEWEDAPEEPKGTYFINTQGDVQFWDSSSFAYPDDWTKEKEIGNYFESREEAEKALEKLKAWKRLENARFEFGTIKYNLDEESSSTIAYDGIITIKGMAYEDFVEDLNTCFGGEG